MSFHYWLVFLIPLLTNGDQPSVPQHAESQTVTTSYVACEPFPECEIEDIEKQTSRE